MEMENIVIYALMALMVVLGIVILKGKGDGLIAGYNTASKDERDKVNIKRLRLLVGVLLLLSGGLMPLLLTMEVMGGLVYTVVIIVGALVGVILANTWAMKK